MQCSCGHVNAEGARICGGCGDPLMAAGVGAADGGYGAPGGGGPVPATVPEEDVPGEGPYPGGGPMDPTYTEPGGWGDQPIPPTEFEDVDGQIGGAAVPPTEQANWSGQQQAFDAGPRTVLQEEMNKPIGGWFVVLRSREVPPYTEIPLFEGNNTIGRAPDLGPQCLSDSRASEQHARIVVAKAACDLIDMGSKNGVTVNNQKIATHRLTRGDRVKIGKTTMVFIPMPDEKGRA